MQIEFQNECALPARCSRCGDIFDLSYDVSIDEGMMEEFVSVMKQTGLQAGLLCWDCR